MTQKDDKDTIPPFYDTLKQKRSHENKTRREISLFTMLLGLMILSTALLGGAKLAWDMLMQDQVSGVTEKMLLLALAFLLGWVICLVSIRAFGNLVLPIVLIGYSLGTVAGILAIYTWVVVKLFRGSYLDQYDRPLYSLLIITGFVILVALTLLLEEFDMRPPSIPLLAGTVFHLFATIVYYLFTPGNDPKFIYGHIYFFLFMLITAGLILAHLGIFSPLRRLISQLFAKKNLRPDD